jgi:hypothetical protein
MFFFCQVRGFEGLLSPSDIQTRSHIVWAPSPIFLHRHNSSHANHNVAENSGLRSHRVCCCSTMTVVRTKETLYTSANVTGATETLTWGISSRRSCWWVFFFCFDTSGWSDHHRDPAANIPSTGSLGLPIHSSNYEILENNRVSRETCHIFSGAHEHLYSTWGHRSFKRLY